MIKKAGKYQGDIKNDFCYFYSKNHTNEILGYFSGVFCTCLW